MVIYEGPSALDGEPIAIIVTGTEKQKPSHNIKTGPMAQVYILRSDVHPVEASRSGQDTSICGNCIHKQTNNGSCYVDLSKGVSAVWKAYKANRYRHESPSVVGFGKSIRLGAYGDPAAIPQNILRQLLSGARMWTGYTHTPHESLKRVVQASADSPKEALRLQEQGWKTFRTRLPDEPLLKNEIICPNESSDLQCYACGLCNGQRKNIVVTIHGTTNKVTKYKHWRLSNG